MNNLQRLELIDKIGRELQRRMRFVDIDVYLKGFDIEINTTHDEHNSKWTYVLEVLSPVNKDIVIKIAKELEIDDIDKYASSDNIVHNTPFWEDNHFRLFLSHLSTFKKNTELLKQALLKYNISSFVAHEDVKPSTIWQTEIEKALLTSDALAAILMDGFKESDWTDQEVGSAIGQGKIIIPIIKDLEPYGFIAKYQGLKASNKSVADVAKGIKEILVTNDKTKDVYFDYLVKGIVASNIVEMASKRVELLSNLDNVPYNVIEKLHNNVNNNSFFVENEPLKKKLNMIFTKYGFSHINQYVGFDSFENDDDIPF